MSLEFYDVVRVDGPLAPDEIRGRVGYLTGRGEGADGPWGVFGYGLERVWSVRPGTLMPLGYRDEIAANRRRGPAVHVRVDPKTGRGEIAG